MPSEVTQLLSALDHGDPRAAEELLPLVYEELRRLATSRMARETPGQTLQPTALVHEVWLRLAGDEAATWQNRGHFFAAAAEAMRRILIERARRKARQRHGGEWQRVEFDHLTVAVNDPDDVLLAVSEAVEQLARVEPLKADIVKLRYFVGLGQPEIAALLGLSEPTLRRHWAYARAWLCAELQGGKKLPPD